MSDYIDRAEALNAISNWLRKAKCPLNASKYNRGEIDAYETAIEEIGELPAADVAPVVRCRDCKHYKIGPDMVVECTRFMLFTAEDDYCSSGAKMDGGDHDADG